MLGFNHYFNMFPKGYRLQNKNNGFISGLKFDTKNGVIQPSHRQAMQKGVSEPDKGVNARFSSLIQMKDLGTGVQ